MDNRTFSRQLEQRTKSFAIDIIRLSGILPRSPESRIIKNQVTKSGTVLEQTTERLTDQEVKLILQIR